MTGMTHGDTSAPDRTILTAEVGSRAHGLATEGVGATPDPQAHSLYVLGEPGVARKVYAEQAARIKADAEGITR